jgi:uncharacterized membrane protein
MKTAQTGPVVAFVDRLFLFLSRHWLAVLNVATGLWVLLPWLAPVFMHIGAVLPARALYLFYSFQCHQLPQRSYFLFGSRLMIPLNDLLAAWPAGDPMSLRPFVGNAEMGWKVAWSDRMVSLYTPLFVGGLLYALSGRGWKPLSYRTWLICSVPMVIDGLSHLISDVLGWGIRDGNVWLAFISGGAWPHAFYAGDLIGSFNWWMRLLTGLLAGFATVWMLYPRVNAEFAQMARRLERK